MTVQERKEVIMKLLDAQSSVSVSQLSEVLKVSEVSVRKLLNKKDPLREHGEEL